MSRPTLDTAGSYLFSNTGLSPSVAGFPKTFLLTCMMRVAVLTPGKKDSGDYIFPLNSSFTSFEFVTRN